MTCQTDDPAREKDYLFFIENVEPEAKIGFSELDRKYLGTPARKSLPPEQYFVLDRKTENNVALFREENVELEKEETKLAQSFQKTTGAMTVLYEGQERTMHKWDDSWKNLTATFERKHGSSQSPAGRKTRTP
jgi:oligoendopeptidase F